MLIWHCALWLWQLPGSCEMSVRETLRTNTEVFVFPLPILKRRTGAKLKQWVEKSTVKRGDKVSTKQFVIFRAGKCGNGSSLKPLQNRSDHTCTELTPAGLTCSLKSSQATNQSLPQNQLSSPPLSARWDRNDTCSASAEEKCRSDSWSILLKEVPFASTYKRTLLVNAETFLLHQKIVFRKNWGCFSLFPQHCTLSSQCSPCLGRR